MQADNQNWPVILREVNKAQWPYIGEHAPEKVWRSRDYLVLGYLEELPDVVMRLSICRTQHDGNSWRDNIPWEDLQRLKMEAGFPHLDAVEVYPSQGDVVNVSNMRHLWILSNPVAFAWRKAR